jgi:hypothetical protein
MKSLFREIKEMRRDLVFRLERKIRSQYSEYDILQMHDGLYTLAKKPAVKLRDTIESRIIGGLNGSSPVATSSKDSEALAQLRNMLNQSAPELALQKVLLNILHPNWKGQVANEVSMSPIDGYRGMRMDVVLGSDNDTPGQIMELKRGSYRLVAHRGKPMERISKNVSRVVRQIDDYANRVSVDEELRRKLGLEKFDLRVVAGRRLDNEHEYTFITQAETEASDSSFRLQIYTWDGLLAELERILD